MQCMIEIKSRVLDCCDVTDIERLTLFLNICVTWEETGVRLVLLRSTNKNPLPSNATDMLAEDTGNYSPEQSNFVRTVPYCELEGATPYLAVHTRPGVAYEVGVLSRQCKQSSH